MPSHWPLLRLVRLVSLSAGWRRRAGMGSLRFEKSDNHLNNYELLIKTPDLVVFTKHQAFFYALWRNGIYY
jgi:hypothetical protein